MHQSFRIVEDGYPTLVLTPLFSSSADAQPATGQFEPSSNFQVRAVQSAELDGLAEILADGFHPQDGILGWAYPLLRLGIYEDLRNRLRSTAPNHICMVAIDLSVTATTQGSPYAGNELAGTVEMALRSNELWKSDFNASNKRVRSQYLYVSNLAVRPTHRRPRRLEVFGGFERARDELGLQGIGRPIGDNANDFVRLALACDGKARFERVPKPLWDPRIRKHDAAEFTVKHRLGADPVVHRAGQGSGQTRREGDERGRNFVSAGRSLVADGLEADGFCKGLTRGNAGEQPRERHAAAEPLAR